MDGAGTPGQSSTRTLPGLSERSAPLEGRGGMEKKEDDHGKKKKEEAEEEEEGVEEEEEGWEDIL